MTRRHRLAAAALALVLLAATAAAGPGPAAVADSAAPSRLSPPPRPPTPTATPTPQPAAPAAALHAAGPVRNTDHTGPVVVVTIRRLPPAPTYQAYGVVAHCAGDARQVLAELAEPGTHVVAVPATTVELVTLGAWRSAGTVDLAPHAPDDCDREAPP